ncbi:glutathione S-transferase N-terminal domain-containing protein [Hydrogenophaga sp.]|jgi:glutathione S-transferase
MKLIGAITSPYVRKVRVVMAEKKLDYQFILEDVWSADTTIMTSNPLGKVPCLVMEGGEAVFDSRVIVEYLDTLSPVGKLIPTQGRERAEVKTWEALADGVLDAAVLARLEATWPGRTSEQRSEAWIDRQRAKIDASLKSMSQGLGEKAFCSGIHFSLSDVAVGCALGYLDFRFSSIDWRTPYPNLARLAEKLNQRQSFVDTKPV